MRIGIGTVATICLLVGCQQPRPVCGDLEGAWQITSIREEGPADTSSNLDPQPSVIIFTPSHYSMVWIPGSTATQAFAERWNPTDDEKIARYGEIVVNAGWYELTDSTLTTHPLVARVPEFMGGSLLYRYQLVGDTLILTTLDEYSYDSVQAPWVGAGTQVTLVLTCIDDISHPR
ncbi:MAG: hypothetical protein GTO22_07660 [Gemmatimonadales bacterium]|nr:hypothetical protein [Gemmatimonadales bacterium]